LEKLRQNYEVDIFWRAFLLRPPGSPPLTERERAQIELKRPVMEEVARRDYGLQINVGPFGIDPLAALIGEKYVEAQGLDKADLYHYKVSKAYWQDAQSIDDLSVLEKLAVESGVDGKAFRAALGDPQYAQQVYADVQEAYQIGINGVPALIFNRKYLVSGAQPYPVLEQVIARIRQMESQSTG
jgi:predicted DsbA family dithiol-disulfide isomerase